MGVLLLGVSLLAPAVPVIRAQQDDGSAAPAMSKPTAPGRFVVYFGFDKAALDPIGRRAVAEAADADKRTGAARIADTGHAGSARRITTTLGAPCRGGAVEIGRLGIPAAAIGTAGRGGQDLVAPTAGGVPDVDDRPAGRSVLTLDFAPDPGFARPHLSANFGGVYGKDVQTGLVAGPELALDLNLVPGFTLRPRFAYDFQLRNPSWDEDILRAGLDLGLRC